MPEADDVLRYAFSQGPGRDFVARLGPPERPLTTSFGTLPDGVATDPMHQLVWGSVDLFEDALYPGRCTTVGLSTEELIQHALVMAFGLQRREPSNLFNDHRGLASVRSKFPVHAFVHNQDAAWLLDVHRHGLLPVGHACPRFPQQPVSVALAGRYTHLPSLYGRLRGPLTELEIGISLRALWVALDVLGLNGELRLPGPDSDALMAQLGLDPPGQWSVPLSVAIDHSQQGHADGSSPSAANGAGDRRTRRSDDEDDDPTLAEVVAVNRTSRQVAAGGLSESSRGSARAVPTGLAPSTRSWSDVLWQRSAGRMPRNMAGFSGRRRPIPAAAVTDAVAWLDVAPPTPLLAEIAQRITVTACLQDATDFATGHYRLERGDAGRTDDPTATPGRPTDPDTTQRRPTDPDTRTGRPTDPDSRPGTATARQGQTGPAARLVLVRADPALPARMEGCYGHGLGPNVGCAVRHASMTWLLSADVTSLIEEFGPGGWTLAQYVCGWMAHGLCLSAAAHGLYARPSRAFDEVLLHPIIGMTPGEMVLLSVVSGVGRFTEPTLDLRT
jgi:hypothetical protein